MPVVSAHRVVYAAAASAVVAAESHAVVTGADGLLTDCLRTLIGPMFGVRWWLTGAWLFWFGGHLLFRWPL